MSYLQDNTAVGSRLKHIPFTNGLDEKANLNKIYGNQPFKYLFDISE